MVMEGSNLTSLLLQVDSLPNSSRQVLDSVWIPNPSPPFHGSTGLVNFTESQGDDTVEKSFFSQIDKEDDENDNDSCQQQPRKKRRLTANQVRFLERSFEVEDKLEPDRKLQLAKEIGLQPRQVAIWFQNRRARYKTKQLEKDYGCLKSSYDKLMSDYDTLFNENDKLKNEVHLLTEQLLATEKDGTKTETFDSEKQIPCIVVGLNESSEIPMVKHEVASSTESEVFDSDSSGGNHSSFQEPDGNQDDDDTLSRSLLQPPPYFPKLEDVCCNEIPGNSCMLLGFPTEEDQTNWLWPY